MSFTSSVRFSLKIKKREFASILYEILSMIKGGSTKTSIATKMGLNFQRASSSVNLLLATGHLQKHSGEGQTTYVLTDKGERFLAGLASIRDNMTELLTYSWPVAALVVGRVLPLHPRHDYRPAHVRLETEQPTVS